MHWGNLRRDMPASKSKRCWRAIRSRGLCDPGLSLLHCAWCPQLPPLSVAMKHLFGGQNFMRNSSLFYWRLRHRSLDGKSYLRTRLKPLLLGQWHAEIFFLKQTEPDLSKAMTQAKCVCVCVWGGGGGLIHNPTCFSGPLSLFPIISFFYLP